jgi:hypothetical protein
VCLQWRSTPQYVYNLVYIKSHGRRSLPHTISFSYKKRNNSEMKYSNFYAAPCKSKIFSVYINFLDAEVLEMIQRNAPTPLYLNR